VCCTARRLVLQNQIGKRFVYKIAMFEIETQAREYHRFACVLMYNVRFSLPRTSDSMHVPPMFRWNSAQVSADISNAKRPTTGTIMHVSFCDPNLDGTYCSN
jgi:hypothetical protein